MAAALQLRQQGRAAYAGRLRVRLARAALSRLMEPSDVTGLALVAAAGPVEALALIGSAARSRHRWHSRSAKSWPGQEPAGWNGSCRRR